MQTSLFAVLELDQSALWTLSGLLRRTRLCDADADWLEDGSLWSQEPRGPFAVAVDDGGYADLGVDGLHGSGYDGSNGVVHLGVRHLLNRVPRHSEPAGEDVPVVRLVMLLPNGLETTTGLPAGS